MSSDMLSMPLRRVGVMLFGSPARDVMEKKVIVQKQPRSRGKAKAKGSGSSVENNRQENAILESEA